jgi:hypothetical protein
MGGNDTAPGNPGKNSAICRQDDRMNRFKEQRKTQEIKMSED